MEFFEHLSIGFQAALTWWNLLYCLIGVFIGTLIGVLPGLGPTATIAMLFQTRPHAFLIGGFVLLVALLFLGIGFLSLQNKRYFEEQFHIATTLLKHHRGLEENGG